MRALFKDWDPRSVCFCQPQTLLKKPKVTTTEPPGRHSLQKILSCVSSASKWKIRDGPELQSWTRVSPTTPSLAYHDPPLLRPQQNLTPLTAEPRRPPRRRLPPYRALSIPRCCHGHRRRCRPWHSARRSLQIKHQLHPQFHLRLNSHLHSQLHLHLPLPITHHPLNPPPLRIPPQAPRHHKRARRPRQPIPLAHARRPRARRARRGVADDRH